MNRINRIYLVLCYVEISEIILGQMKQKSMNHSYLRTQGTKPFNASLASLLGLMAYCHAHV